jgi:ribosomal protein L11 methyltransferase
VIRLAVRVRRADAELVLAELLELAPGGVEESEDGDVVEYAVYGPPGELPELPDLRAAAGEALVEIRTREVADDWPERWRAFHQPITVGDRLHVRPPWSRTKGV